MIDDALEELRGSIEKTHTALKRDLAKLRTGRAHPSLLDSIRVESYGAPLPLSQMATINAPDSHLLVIKVWDRSQMKAVEKAIVQSPLGLNPQNDGDVIRVPLPALSEERRKDLCKIAKRSGEESKVAIRNLRRDTKEILNSLKEGKEVGEDDVDRALKKVDDEIHKATSEIEAIVAAKEKDILAV
jgi:ribosome recycling factor